jgi:hypothetical protein
MTQRARRPAVFMEARFVIVRGVGGVFDPDLRESGPQAPPTREAYWLSSLIPAQYPASHCHPVGWL